MITLDYARHLALLVKPITKEELDEVLQCVMFLQRLDEESESRMRKALITWALVDDKV